MKKLLSVLLILTAFTALFIGCKSGGTPVYTVTFDTQTSVEIEPQSITKGELATAPDVELSRTGYAFFGWDYDFDKPIKKNTLITAVWKSNAYAVKYHANAPGQKTAYGAIKDSSHFFDTEKALSKNDFFIVNYSFTEWNTKPDGSGENFFNRENVLNLSENDGEIINLYAMWERASSQNPCALSEPFHLFALAEEVNKLGFEGGWFALSNNISLENKEWTPIGKNHATPFFGNFDGKDHIIEGLKITEPHQYSGFFGRNLGYINNLTIKNLEISAYYNSTLLEYVCVGGLVGSNEGIITYCGVVDSSVGLLGILDSDFAHDEFFAYAGGLVGENYDGTMAGCFSDVEIFADVSEPSVSIDIVIFVYAGGIVGDNDGQIRNCEAFGNVSAAVLATDSVAYAGGLIGRNADSANPVLECRAEGNAEALSQSLGGVAYSYAGGLIGRNYIGTIKSCSAAGNVFSRALYSGDTVSYAYAGGLVGECFLETPTIIDCSVFEGQQFERVDYSGAYNTPSNYFC